MPRKAVSIMLYLSFIFMLASAAWMAYSDAYGYERKTGELKDRLHAKPKLRSLIRHAGELATFGIYKGYSREINALNRILIEIHNHKQRAAGATVGFFFLSGMFLLFTYVFVSKETLFVAAMLVISLISLTVGLFAPILTIVTYKEMPILGQVVFLFQSKGIVTTIETLFASGNILVAIPLCLFSVIIPLLKTLLMGLILLGSPRGYLGTQSLCIIRHIGKWSMADVFVVTLLLTYFTVNKDKFTNAEVQIGLYFFLGYVILSMIVSHLLGEPRKQGISTTNQPLTRT